MKFLFIMKHKLIKAIYSERFSTNVVEHVLLSAWIKQFFLRLIGPQQRLSNSLSRSPGKCYTRAT